MRDEEIKEIKDDEVVRFKLTKKPLKSEREEIRNKRRHNLFLVIIAVFILVVGFECGLLFNRFNMQPTKTLNDEKLEEIAYYFENYWLYAQNYPDLANTLYDKALYGMTSFSEDPFTTYASKSEMEKYNDELNVEFVGVGVTYRVAGNYFVIVDVYYNSPAYKAGLEPGDIMMAVDHNSIDGLTSDEVKEMVLGDKDSELTITINRDGEIKDAVVIRDEVNSSAYAYNIDDTVILEIYSFGLNTYEECVEYLNEYDDYHKIIIDLRDNGGGYSVAVEQIAGLFLKEGSIVMREVNKDGEEYISYVDSDKYFDNFSEIIVLVNNNTASASEVLTMALKENHPNTKVLGQTTFGKGVVQSLLTLSDGSTLKLTTMNWLSSNGISINNEGIKPDFEVLQDDIYYDFYYPMEDDMTFTLDSVSEYNRLMQKSLKYIGYDILRTDGYLDENSFNIIKEFQEDYHLESDGIIDTETYNMVIAISYKKAFNSIDKDNQLMEALEIING